MIRRIEFQRTEPGLASFVPEVLGEVDLAEVFEKDGIVGHHGNGPFHFFQGLLEAAHLVVGPGETVEIVAILGLDRERPLDQRNRFFQSHVALGISIAQVIERIGVLRIQPDGLLHLMDQLVEAAHLVVRGPQVEMEIGASGIALQPLAKDRHRFLLARRLDQSQTQQEVRLRHLGVEGDDLLEMRERLIIPFEAIQQVAEMEMRVGVPLVGLNDHPVFRDGFVVILHFFVQVGQMIADS